MPSDADHNPSNSDLEPTCLHGGATAAPSYSSCQIMMRRKTPKTGFPQIMMRTTIKHIFNKIFEVNEDYLTLPHLSTRCTNFEFKRRLDFSFSPFIFTCTVFLHGLILNASVGQIFDSLCDHSAYRCKLYSSVLETYDTKTPRTNFIT